MLIPAYFEIHNETKQIGDATLNFIVLLIQKQCLNFIRTNIYTLNSSQKTKSSFRKTNE